MLKVVNTYIEEILSNRMNQSITLLNELNAEIKSNDDTIGIISKSLNALMTEK